MAQRQIDKGLILIGIMILLALGITTFLLLQVRTDEISVRTANGKDVPVLMLVQDKGQLVLSHVILLNPRTKRLAMIDVPTNLGAIIDSLQRVDSVSTLWKEKGQEAYVKYLEKLLEVELPFQIVLDMDSVGLVSDFLSGLEVFVPDSIDAKTDDGTLIRIPNGTVLMDGDKMREFLSYETDTEREQERSNRRWAFTKALLSRLAFHADAVSNPRFMTYLMRFMPGNMEDRTLQAWIGLLSGVNFEQMLNQKVLGNSRTVDTKDGARTLLFPHFDGQLVKDSLRQVSANLAAVEDGKDGSPIRLEILNGTDLPGIARKAKDLYVNYGFEVVRFGNAASTTQALTQVIDRRGNLSVAERTAKIIRCEQINTQLVAQGSDPDSEVDVTIILGKDFDGWYVKKD